MNIKKSKLSVLTHKSYKKRNDTKHQNEKGEISNEH